MQKKQLVHLISSLKRGGAESLLVDLLAELNDFEHHVVYFHDGPNRQQLEKIGIKTYHIKGLFFLYDPIFFVRLVRLTKKIKPDCIHSALWAANFAGRLIAKILNIPLISVVHLGVHQDGKLRNIIDSFTFRSCKKAVAVSDEVAQSLKKKRWLSTERISIITNGINSERIYEQAQHDIVTRAKLNIPSDAFVIGSVGRFIPRKNFPLLMRSFAECAKFTKSHLVLVGFGPIEHELRRLSKELSIEKQVILIVGRAAYGLYPLFDCFVLPSFKEGMSIALLEAMCFSLPCIVTSPQGEKHEVIQSGKNGLVVPSNDQNLLTENLLLLSSDKALCQKLGNNALISIKQHFSIATMAENYKKIFIIEIDNKSL